MAMYAADKDIINNDIIASTINNKVHCVRSNSVLNLDLDRNLVSDIKTLDLAEVDLTQCICTKPPGMQASIFGACPKPG